MEYFKKLVLQLHWPTYLTAASVCAFAYFIFTTLVLRLTSYPSRPPEIISDQPYLPEPLEAPLYLASFIAVPLLGLILYPLTRRILLSLSSRKIQISIIVGAIILAALGFIFAYLKGLIPLSTIISYLQSHSPTEVFRFIVAKRILIASLILAGSGIVWITNFLLNLHITFSRLFSERTERRIRELLPFIALALAILLYHPNFPYDQHHHNYMIGAVNDIFHGKPLLYETFNLYGVLNVYTLALFLSLLPFTYQSFSLILFVTYVGYFLGIYYLLFRWLKSHAWALLGTLLSIAVTYFLQISPEQSAYEFHNTGPYRYWLYVPITILMLRYARAKNIWTRRGIICLSGIALFWTFDTGLYLTAATFITLLIADWRDSNNFKQRSKLLISLAFQYLISIVLVLAAISLINYQFLHSWPHWTQALKGLLEFRSGIGMRAHPVVGVYLLIVTAYILMLVWVARKLILNRSYDLVVMFLLLYGIFAFNYYIGFSVWQLLYYSAPPLLLLIVYFLHRASNRKYQKIVEEARERAIFETTTVRSEALRASLVAKKSSLPEPLYQRTFNATLISILFFTSAIFLVKIPIEFSHRDYTHLMSSLTEVPIRTPSIYQDEAMYQDAQKIKELYPGVTRFPVVHRRSARLLYFLKAANFFDFYELQTVTYQRELDQMTEKLTTERPPLLIIGKEKNRIIEAFENTMPKIYKKSLSLQTLDIYTTEPVY